MHAHAARAHAASDDGSVHCNARCIVVRPSGCPGLYIARAMMSVSIACTKSTTWHPTLGRLEQFRPIKISTVTAIFISHSHGICMLQLSYFACAFVVRVESKQPDLLTSRLHEPFQCFSFCFLLLLFYFILFYFLYLFFHDRRSK